MPDPLQQLITVPHFYLAFFGQNDKYAELLGTETIADWLNWER